MLFREIVSTYSDTQMRHKFTLCGQTADIFNSKAGGKYNIHGA
jgi:hypothetical protein